MSHGSNLPESYFLQAVAPSGTLVEPRFCPWRCCCNRPDLCRSRNWATRSNSRKSSRHFIKAAETSQTKLIPSQAPPPALAPNSAPRGGQNRASASADAKDTPATLPSSHNVRSICVNQSALCAGFRSAAARVDPGRRPDWPSVGTASPTRAAPAPSGGLPGPSVGLRPALDSAQRVLPALPRAEPPRT